MGQAMKLDNYNGLRGVYNFRAFNYSRLHIGDRFQWGNDGYIIRQIEGHGSMNSFGEKSIGFVAERIL